MKILSFLAFFACVFTVFGQVIHHKVSMPNPETHYFHVQTTLKDFKDKELILTMPVWSPGSYLIREYPQNVNQVRAKDRNGNALPIRKITKNQWKLEKGRAKEVTIEYEYYAFELTVRTSFLDETHGYFNGSNLFTCPEGYEDLGGKLTIVPHSTFKKITIPLPEQADGFAADVNAKTYIFQDFEELTDTPCEIGNQETFSFEAAGTIHHVAIYGVGSYDVDLLKRDMAKIVESATKIFGENPNKEYWFIIHNVVGGTGGLEHKNSTTLSTDRWVYSGNTYNNFLSLVAHEYFHVWLVKRLRPSELVTYDFSQENYTDWLWVMEGFTAYYDELILRRAGIYTKQEFFNKFRGTLNWIEGTIGNNVQPVADASFDAWIKAYRPNENSSNTTISYYSKGGIIAGVFDAMIISNSNGEKSLDDFMKELYQNYYVKKNVGINYDNFTKTLAKYTGKEMHDFFEKYIYGTEQIPFEKYFTPIGIEVNRYVSERLEFGASLSKSGGKLIVNSVASGSAAEKAGLSPNDEIIAFNGFRVNKNDFERFIFQLDEGDDFNLIISRDLKLISLDSKMEYIKTPKVEMNYVGSRLGEYWLRED